MCIICALTAQQWRPFRFVFSKRKEKKKKVLKKLEGMTDPHILTSLNNVNIYIILRSHWSSSFTDSKKKKKENVQGGHYWSMARMFFGVDSSFRCFVVNLWRSERTISFTSQTEWWVKALEIFPFEWTELLLFLWQV